MQDDAAQDDAARAGSRAGGWTEDADELAELFDGVFTAAHVGIGVWDRELRYRRVNEALARMSGAGPEDHVGRRPPEVAGEMGERTTETLAERPASRACPSRNARRGTR